MFLFRELMNFGLTEKEARVYMAALEMGGSSVQKLGQKACVNRATVYTNLEHLIALGLIKSEQVGKKIRFYAEEPEKVIEILIKNEEQVLAEREGEITDLLPKLNAVQSSAHATPVVRYFEGRTGVRQLVREVFMGSDDRLLRIMYPNDLLMRFFSKEELEQLVAERKSLGINFKAIYTASHPLTDDNQNQHYLSRHRFDLGCDIAFFGDQVRIISLEDPIIGVIIEDKNITQSFKDIFDYIYRGIEDGLLR